MRLISKHGKVWEIVERGGFFLDRENHHTGYLLEGGAIQLSFSTEEGLVGDHTVSHVGIYRRQWVYVTFPWKEAMTCD